MQPGRAADNSPTSSAKVMEEYSYTSAHPLGHAGLVTGSLYLFTFYRPLNETGMSFNLTFLTQNSLHVMEINIASINKFPLCFVTVLNFF